MLSIVLPQRLSVSLQLTIYSLTTFIFSLLTHFDIWTRQHHPCWQPPGVDRIDNPLVALPTSVLHTHAACTAYNPLHIQLLICSANAPLNSTSWAMPFQLPYPHQLFILMISQLLITYGYQIAQQKHPITTSQQCQLSNAILLATSVICTHDTPTACNPLHMQLWIAPLMCTITTIRALGCAS